LVGGGGGGPLHDTEALPILYVLFAVAGKKRPKNSPSDETPTKKARKETDSPIHRSASGSSLASRALNEPERPGSRGSPEVGITEEAVRRYLSHKPMTTKDLLKKFKTKKTGLTSEQTVQQIAAILKKIVPEQKMIKGKLYLSLKRS
jgi:transcription initiation factor TFIIF subunit alpha